MEALDVVQYLAMMVIWFYPLSLILELSAHVLGIAGSFIWQKMSWVILAICYYLCCLYFSIYCIYGAALGIPKIFVILIGLVLMYSKCKKFFAGGDLLKQIGGYLTVGSIISVVVLCLFNISFGSILIDWYFVFVRWLTSIPFIASILVYVAIPLAVAIFLYKVVSLIIALITYTAFKRTYSNNQ